MLQIKLAMIYTVMHISSFSLALKGEKVIETISIGPITISYSGISPEFYNGCNIADSAPNTPQQ